MKKLLHTLLGYVILGVMAAAAFAAAAFGVVEQVEHQDRTEKSWLSPMSCNQALQAGFRIYDPEGFEVERFDDEGNDYWTTEEKTAP